MAQKGFGRRHTSPCSDTTRPAAAGGSASPAADDGDPLATSPSASTRRSIAVLAGIATVVTVTAGGLAYALGAATGEGAARNACDPSRDKCINQYQVTLGCNGEQQPKTVSVQAQTADQAEAKAERYNRGCRARGSAFVAAVLNTAARNYYGSRAGETHVADDSGPKSRRTWRLRRR